MSKNFYDEDSLEELNEHEEEVEDHWRYDNNDEEEFDEEKNEDY